MSELQRTKSRKRRRKSRTGLLLALLCVSLPALAFIIPKGVTYAKYLNDLYDFTGAVAGDFLFTSNYLEEPVKTAAGTTTRTYDITSWDGRSYSFDFEVRNFANSLRFNEKGLDCYYCLEASVQHKGGDGQWIDGFESPNTTKGSFSYKISAGGKELSGTDLVYYRTTEGGYSYLPAVKLPAMTKGFDRDEGTHKISVTMSIPDTVKLTADHKLTLTARTVPASRRGRLLVWDGKTEEAYVKEGFSPHGYRPLTETDYPADGVYDVTLSCDIRLTQKTSFQNVEADWRRVDQNSRDLIYSLNCSSSEASSLTNVRVFFNSKRLNADENLLTRGRTQFSQAKTSYAEGGVLLSDANTDVRFFDTQVQSSSASQLLFHTGWYASQDGTNSLNIPLEVLPDNEAVNWGGREEWTAGTPVPDIWFEILDEYTPAESFEYVETTNPDELIEEEDDEAATEDASEETTAEAGGEGS